MTAQMVPVIIPGEGDFKHERAVFNPTVCIDPHTGAVHLFARGVRAGERASRIIHAAGPREGPFSLLGEPEIVIEVKNEPVTLTRRRLGHSHEDPRFLSGGCITVVGLDEPPYTSVGQRAKTYLGTVAGFHKIVVTELLTPRSMPDVDDRHVLPIDNHDGTFTVFTRPQRESLEGDYVDYFSGGPSSVYVTRSSDLTERPVSRRLLTPQEWWEARRIGGVGPQPVSTRGGIFAVYMGIDEKGAYRVGAALIDPATLTLIARTRNPLLEPNRMLSRLFSVEKHGFGHPAGVVFASGMLIDDASGTIDLYCGYNDLGMVWAQMSIREILASLDDPAAAPQLLDSF